MKSINEIYFNIIEEINKMKSLGISFMWNHIDLSDILISEFVATYNSNRILKRNSLIDVIKLKSHGFLKRSRSNKSKKSKTGNLLVFINEPNQWDNIEPVCQLLIEKGVPIHFVTTKEKIVNEYFLKYDSYTFAYGFSLQKKIRFASSNNQITNTIHNNLPRITYLYNTFSKLLNNSTINYVLIGNDNTLEGRLLAKIAKKYNKRIGTIQHGSINRVNPVYGLSVADDYFVYGQSPACELLFLGKNKDNIIVSGWPLQPVFKQKLSEVKVKENSLYKSDLLICLSGVGHTVSLELHQKIIELIKRLQFELSLSIVVKLHPKDKVEFYSSLDANRTKYIDNNYLKSKNVSLQDLFTQSICTITVASNAALESLLSETPVITVDLNKSFNDIDFIKDGLTHHVSNYDELKETFIKLKKIKRQGFDIETKKKIEEYYFNYFSENYNPNLIIVEKILKTCVE